MTDFSKIIDSLRPTDDEVLGAYDAHQALSRTFVAPQDNISLFGPTAPDSIGTWDRIFYALGKPEEWLTKAIGGVLSDDPKYNFGTGRPGDQVSFADLAGDAFEGAIGDRMPITSAIVGLGAAIINPLDPLNKLKLFSLTEKGIQTQRVQKLYNANKNLFKIEKGVGKFDTRPVQEALRAAEKNKKAITAAKKDTREIDRHIQLLQQEKREYDSLNDYLKSIWKEGTNIEDIKLAPKRSQMILEGDYRVAGLGNPLKMEHVPFVGKANRDPTDYASRSVVSGGFLSRGLPFIPELSASVMRGVEAAGGFAKDLLKKGGEYLTAKTNYHFIGKYRPLVQEYDKIYDAVDYSAKERELRLLDTFRQFKELGFQPDEIEEVFRDYYNTIEKVDPHRAQAVIATVKQQASQVFTEAIPGKSIKPKQVVNPELLSGTKATTDPSTGRPLVASTELLRSDIDDAIKAWETGTPKRPRRGGKPQMLTGRHIIIGAVNHKVDQDVIQQLREIEGAIGYEFVQHGDGEILVGKRPLGTRGLTTLMDPDTQGVLYSADHHRSMEILAAQLTERGLAFNDLRPTDFLFTDEGRAYLINPQAVEPFSKKIGKQKIDPTLMAYNKAKLLSFAYDHGHGVDATELSILDSLRATKQAAVMARKVRVSRRNFNIGDVPEGEDVRLVDAAQLLKEANNTLFYEQLLYGHGRKMLEALRSEPGPKAAELHFLANDIERQVGEIRASLDSGQPLSIDPIVIGKTADGRLEIIKGRSTLVAALLSDVSHVKVKLDEIATH